MRSSRRATTDAAKNAVARFICSHGQALFQQKTDWREGRFVAARAEQLDRKLETGRSPA